MKAIFSILFANSLLASVILNAKADPAAVSANTPAPIRVVCVGDSITQGVANSPGKSYPDDLQKLLGSGWLVKNCGVSGRTLLKKGDAPYWNEQAFKDAQTFAPNDVVIMLGTNDAKPQNWVHHDEFYGDYKDLIETFKNLPGKPKIFICRPCPVFEPGNYGILAPNLAVEIPLIDKLAAEEKVELIDMHAPLADKPQLVPDKVHPNDDGAAVMAQTAATALTGKAAKAP